jgi:hypothetical protein
MQTIVEELERRHITRTGSTRQSRSCPRRQADV